jgi:hypothetical protein
MSEVIRNSQEEFWHPPVPDGPFPSPGLADACGGCGAEFMLGAKFCHACGASRQAQANLADLTGWTRLLQALRVLEFHNFKRWLGLSTASLIAFLAGVGCFLGALAVGLIYTAQNFADFQAVQLWRTQWLLGAVAFFVAGILLKRPDRTE